MTSNFDKLLVLPVDGQPLTTSLAIASKFGKKHKNVLQSIQLLECSNEFRRLNFQPRNYEYKTGRNQTRQEKMYYITKDGFMFLAMGFKGREAAVWKERFIIAFNMLLSAVESMRDSELTRLEVMENALFEKNPRWKGILEAKADCKTHKEICGLVDVKSTDTIRRNLRRMEAFGITPLALTQQAQNQGLTLEDVISLIAN